MSVLNTPMFPIFNSASIPVIGTAKPANQTDWLPASFQGGEVDLIHRTITNASTVISHAALPTAHVHNKLLAWHDSLMADVDALVNVAVFQRKYINYQATYNAFLLGALSEEEFEEESDAHMVEEKQFPPEVLAPVLKRLERLLPFDLNQRELGEYLEADQKSIQQALEYLSHQPMLESEDKLHKLISFENLQKPE